MQQCLERGDVALADRPRAPFLQAPDVGFGVHHCTKLRARSQSMQTWAVSSSSSGWAT